MTPAAPVPVDAGCSATDCLELSARQREHQKDLRTFVDRLAITTGSFPDLGVEPDAILNDALATLVSGADDDASYFTAARRALIAFRDGHVDLFSPDRCGTPELPELMNSAVGACTQPYRDHAVVSFVSAGNSLGLASGDEIIEVDGQGGQAMLDGAFNHAACGVGSSSDSNRRYISATSLLGTVHVGSRVVVLHRDGSTETKTVERLGKPLLCRFPGEGNHAYPANATRRSDGVAVIEVPSFLLPTRPQLTESELTATIAEIFDEVKDAPGMVWDLRGNPGGATFVGLSIVGGMPGLRPGTIAKCAERKPGSRPFQAAAGTSFPFVVRPNSAFAYAGKVAVVVDGLTTSAGDYFALAVSTLTQGKVAIVGAPTSGAYGGVGQGYEFGDIAPLRFTADVMRCTDPSDRPLERRAIEPTHPVELEPSDLAAGRDTVLEAAAALVR